MSESESPTTRHIRKRVGRNVFDTPPKISVVIPVYNDAEFINETLDSVIAQKYREHEIIIVNDGSPDTDRLERGLKMRFEDIVYVKERNAGAGVALNTGIEHARGQIIAFLKAGDRWQPDFLAAQYVFLERHGYDMVYCDASFFGTHSAYRRTLMTTAPSEGEANFDSLLDRRCNVITSGTMARKKSIINAGLFETERVRSHNFHLWLRMAKNGAKIGYQRKELAKCRVRPERTVDLISRVERERDVFERVAGTIDLTDVQQKSVALRLARLEADLAVEQGKAFLRSENFREAVAAFRVASGHRRSLKLTAISWLTRIAPRTLTKFYIPNRSDAVAFSSRQS